MKSGIALSSLTIREQECSVCRERIGQDAYLMYITTSQLPLEIEILHLRCEEGAEALFQEDPSAVQWRQRQKP